MTNGVATASTPLTRAWSASTVTNAVFAAPPNAIATDPPPRPFTTASDANWPTALRTSGLFANPPTTPTAVEISLSRTTASPSRPVTKPPTALPNAGPTAGSRKNPVNAVCSAASGLVPVATAAVTCPAARPTAGTTPGWFRKVVMSGVATAVTALTTARSANTVTNAVFVAPPIAAATGPPPSALVTKLPANCPTAERTPGSVASRPTTPTAVEISC